MQVQYAYRAHVERNLVVSIEKGQNHFDAVLRAALPLYPELDVLTIVGAGWPNNDIDQTPTDRLYAAVKALGGDITVFDVEA